MHTAINKMMATIELNPYERELLYGYPYLVGYVQDVPIRAPLLTIPVTISAQGGTLTIKPHEELLRFNSLPFRSEADSAAHELALARLIDATPEFPLSQAALRQFCETVSREMNVEIRGALDGRLDAQPSQPRSEMKLAIIDNAACFVAPKTSYFLASDLETIGKTGEATVVDTSLGWLLGKRKGQATSNVFQDSRKVHYPFSSNPSQRRVALLANDPENHIIVVQGPPGTGKSLTIANVACHLVANGKRVLVTSQKDKALEVVDELLRVLNMAQLPMTLLRQDCDSKRELQERLASIQKTRSAEETERDCVRETREFLHLADITRQTDEQLAGALVAEHLIAQARAAFASAEGILKRVKAGLGLWEARRLARHRGPLMSDHLGELTTKKRAELLEAAMRLLATAAEHRTGKADKSERNQLREFSKLLGRNQTSYKNFSIFDRMKREPDRCEMLLKILPCWIMTPDDVARLFPCEPGLFDVVIIDEASQCDLPSMTPVLYRAKQAIIAGDSKQMQAQRFAFTSSQVSGQAWREHGLDRFDPDRWLDPAKIDLLQLASIRLDEEVFLDEHYRSLPAIIGFSNDRWYGSRLRLMRDTADRRFGDSNSAAITLHRVAEGSVHPGTQENAKEAAALVDALKAHLQHPGYADASFGVICLFEEQMRLVNDLIAEQIAEEDRTRHDLVVVNPDGFQGDERDVIYYSLSYDANGMEQAAISARQAEREHIQGMLNVAFTRSRDEIHVFYSAPIEKFGMATGKGAIREWLEYCDAACKAGAPVTADQVQKAQSEFEAQVMQALAVHGVSTISQYPSCGYFIDIVAEFNDNRIAVECDGEVWHLDEHGELKVEDCQRQEILERAGWKVVRIPYRGWLKQREIQIKRIMESFENKEEDIPDAVTEPSSNGETLRLSVYEAAIVKSLRSGGREREQVLKGARVQLGLSRLSSQTRKTLEDAVAVLAQRKLIVIEDGEIFASESARTATISTYNLPRPTTAPTYYRPYRRYRRHRRRW
jgi:very-short-patch-repair endonuclease